MIAIDEQIDGVDDPDKLLVAAKCYALMIGYDRRWRDAGYVPVSVEETLVADLYNPETLRKSRSFRIAGKIDAVVDDPETGRRLVLDHKTTSDDISDPLAPFWRQLRIDGQSSQYMLLHWLNGRRIDGAIWDVVRKPTIRPKKLSKADAAAVGATGKYFGSPVSDDSLAELAETSRESPEMYEVRLAHDCAVERPEYYFQRRPVPRTDRELLEYAQDVWDIGQDVLTARRSGRHTRNAGACFQYRSPCRFLDLCSGHDSVESDGWVRKDQVHAELPDLEGDGRDVLTHSRARTFQTCRQKEYFAYELGIEQSGKEDKEALYFGSLWHCAQEAWWKAQLKEEHSDGEITAGDEAAARRIR